jgi:signal transduction histidine kinase/ligand-binding sensor domain-containing protein
MFNPLRDFCSKSFGLGLLLWAVTVCAATGSVSWSVRPWLSDDGLPDNDVTGIAQNVEGYLWVATQGGLALFDGVRFREVELSTPSQRTRPLIRLMLLGRDNDLWLALEGGTVISLSSSHTNIFTATDGVPNFRPVSLAQARDGAIWIGYVDGSACRIEKSKITRFSSSSGLSGIGQCALTSDGQGQIWIAKAGQLSVFQDGKFKQMANLPDGVARLAAARGGGIWAGVGSQLLKVSEGKPPEKIAAINFASPGVTPTCVFEDRSGNIWLGTLAGGLFQIFGTNAFAVPTSYPDVLNIAEDREGNLWVGTGGGGLNRLRPRIMELQNKDNGLPLSSVRSICEDAGGTMWVVAQNGELAACLDGSWRNVSNDKVWSGVQATCVASDDAGGVWVGTAHGGLRHMLAGKVTVLGRGDGLGGEVVRALLTDREKNLWIALESPSRVQCYRNGSFQTLTLPAGARTVRAIAQDKTGTVWLGTLDGLLLRVDHGQLVDATPGTLPRAKPIRCLYADSAGDLWIGYAGAGVGRMRDGRFSNVSTSRGLHDAYICAMAEDDGGGYWFCSDHGIFQVRQRELNEAFGNTNGLLRSVIYGRDEALPGLQGNFGYSPNSACDGSGRIWFPTRAGLAVINPNRSVPNHLVPPVIIERVLVDGQPVSWKNGNELLIPPSHRKIEIEFTALSFIAPENISFRTRLDGWDENWVTVPRPQRNVSFTRLPAGKYIFHVTACNSAGIWNENGVKLQFKVEPFLWQKLWFRLGLLSGLVTGVGFIVRFYQRRKFQARLRKLEQEAFLQKERARIAKDLHDELGASLTQISLLGKLTQQDLVEPEKARPHVEKIAGLARQGVKSVDEIVWAVSPRNDTLSQLLDYAGQYAVDFLNSAGIRCRIDFPEKIPNRKLNADIRHGLFMVVKESLNNAVKHSGATEIGLTARLDGSFLNLSVSDNGRGFSCSQENDLSDGLRNMKQRVTDLGGECVIESNPQTGTNVRVQLNLP